MMEIFPVPNNDTTITGGICIHQTVDKGYIISAISFHTGNGDSMYVYKVDSNFQYEWGISEYRVKEIFEPYEMQDGSFLVAGGQERYKRWLYYIKLMQMEMY